MKSVHRNILAALVLVSCAVVSPCHAVIGSGWTTYSPSFVWHDDQVHTRHTEVNGVTYMWAYSTDPMPYGGSGPRSEMRFQNEYTSGSRQFEADCYSASGSEYTTFQIFGATGSATATLLTVKGNSLVRDDNPNVVLASNFRTYVRLNVIHYVSTHMIEVWVNGSKIATYADRGAPSNGAYYHKCGVYGQPDMTSYIESRFKNIKHYRK